MWGGVRLTRRIDLLYFTDALFIDERKTCAREACAGGVGG